MFFWVVVRALLSGYHILLSGCLGVTKRLPHYFGLLLGVANWLPHSFGWLLGCCQAVPMFF